MLAKPKSRVPSALLMQVISMFWQWHDNNTCGDVLTAILFYSPVYDEWMVKIPKQWVKLGISEYDMPEVPGFVVAGSITSVGVLDAFFSSTMCKDAQQYGLHSIHFVVGGFPGDNQPYHRDGPDQSSLYVLQLCTGVVEKGILAISPTAYDVLDYHSCITDEKIEFYPPVSGEGVIVQEDRPKAWFKASS